MMRRAAIFESAAAGILAMTALLYFGNGFGPYWDSWYYFEYAARFSVWITSWVDGNPAPSIFEWRHYYPKEDMHPPLMQWGAGLTHALLSRQLGDLGSCRLFIILFSSLACAAVYGYVRIHAGRAAAMLGAALLAGSPRFWVHALLLNIDGLVASVYLLALLTFPCWERGLRGKGLVLAALTLGFLTKLQAFYLAPLLVLYVTLKGLREGRPWISPFAGSLCQQVAFAAGSIAAALLAAFALWPSLWLDFPEGLFQYIRFITKHSNVPVLYFGTLYKGSGIPPWHYPWVYTAIALPPALIVLFLASLIRTGRKAIAVGFSAIGNNQALLYAAALFPLLMSSLPQAPKYDEVRLLLPSYGPMAILCAFEAGHWWDAFKARALPMVSPLVRRLLLLTVCICALIPTVRIYPYNLVYFSPFIGGVSGAREKGFDLEYLGVSMHFLNPKLRQVARAGDVLLLAGCNALVYQKGPEGWTPIPNGVFPVDFKMLREISFAGKNVFAILSSRYGDLTPEALLVLKHLPAIDQVLYRGERLFSLHRITPEFVKQLPSLLKEEPSKEGN